LGEQRGKGRLGRTLRAVCFYNRGGLPRSAVLLPQAVLRSLFTFFTALVLAVVNFIICELDFNKPDILKNQLSNQKTSFPLADQKSM